MKIFCMSPKVAAAVPAQFQGNVAVAARPSEDALMSLLSPSGNQFPLSLFLSLFRLTSFRKDIIQTRLPWFSDKPPRRSRPQKEPVTIDLKAEQDAAATEQAPETTVTAPLQPDDLAARGEVEGHGEKPSPDAVDVAVAAEPAPPAEGTTDAAKPSAEGIETASISEATPSPTQQRRKR